MLKAKPSRLQQQLTTLLGGNPLGLFIKFHLFAQLLNFPLPNLRHPLRQESRQELLCSESSVLCTHAAHAIFLAHSPALPLLTSPLLGNLTLCPTHTVALQTLL